MKIRNGFVTNSSSSSFIISVHGSKGKPLINFFKFMCDEDYFYNINLSTTYADFQESKQLVMEYAITIKIG